MAKLRVPDQRVYRAKPMPRSDDPAAIKGWIENELRQVTRAIEESGGGGTSGFNAGFWPVLRPEDYGIATDADDVDADEVSDAFDSMIAQSEDEGGAYWYMKGAYPISRPVYVPANVAIVGVARGDKPNEMNGGIRSVTGDFDLLKFGQDVENIFISNMNFGHLGDVTPTAGVAIDMRWLKSAFFLNNVFYNLWNGIDMGVARSTVIQGCYMRGLLGTSSGIGTDADGTPDHGFGIYIRSTQTLLDGNVGKTTQFYDRDGSGVEIEENAKGTSVVLRDIFINGGGIGEADDDGAVFENYTENFTCLWLRGASTVRVDRIQCRHAHIGVRVEYAPNREGVNRDGDETGIQMCADIRISNGSGEGNLVPYQISGFEKVTLETCQANSSAGLTFDIGDNVNTVWPGMGGLIPVREFGGFARLLNCLALSSREEGYQLRSGKIRMDNCIAAGYGFNDEDAIVPGQGVALAASIASARFEFPSTTLGTFTVRNDGANAFRFTVGNSAVVESGGGVLVGVGSYVQFTRTNAVTQSHIAVRTTSGTSTGEAGPEASQNAPGVKIRTGCTDGVWINGGVISYDKDIGDHTPPSQSAIDIQSGVDRVWIRNVDLMGAEIDNNSEGTMTEAEITEFVGNPYHFSTYPRRQINADTGATYTLQMRDNGNVVTLSHGSAITVTIPTHASVPLPVGAEIELMAIGAGTATVVGAGGVTLIVNAATMSTGQGLTIRQVATDVWVVVR